MTDPTQQKKKQAARKLLAFNAWAKENKDLKRSFQAKNIAQAFNIAKEMAQEWKLNVMLQQVFFTPFTEVPYVDYYNKNADNSGVLKDFSGAETDEK